MQVAGFTRRHGESWRQTFSAIFLKKIYLSITQFTREMRVGAPRRDRAVGPKERKQRLVVVDAVLLRAAVLQCGKTVAA